MKDECKAKTEEVDRIKALEKKEEAARVKALKKEAENLAPLILEC